MHIRYAITRPPYNKRSIRIGQTFSHDVIITFSVDMISRHRYYGGQIS